jgi:hypothetical protein
MRRTRSPPPPTQRRSSRTLRADGPYTHLMVVPRVTGVQRQWTPPDSEQEHHDLLPLTLIVGC